MNVFPKEIISEILGHLKQREQVSLRIINKLWRDMVDLSCIKEISLKEICSQGLYVSFINKDFSRDELKESFYEACQNGYIYLVKSLINKGRSNWL